MRQSILRIQIGQYEEIEWFLSLETKKWHVMEKKFVRAHKNISIVQILCISRDVLLKPNKFFDTKYNYLEEKYIELDFMAGLIFYLDCSARNLRR